jgi:hypothetical protein
MKWFGRTGGYYLFWTGFVYFWVGMFDVLVYRFCQPELLSALWVCILMIPLVVPPVARYFNMEPLMFDFFKSREERAKDYDNVVKFPEPPKLVPPAPPEPEPPVKIFYRIGFTDQQRVAFSMGGMEITMNKQGCQQMIEQLTVFMNQLEEEGND